MPTRALRVAVYPLLLINLALGFAMFVVSHQAILITSVVMYQGGMLANETLGPFIYVQQSINIISIIFLALAALILFPVLDSYYSRDLGQARILLEKFFFVLGVQFCYLGVIQFWITLLVDGRFTFDLSMMLIIGQLVVGAIMVIWARGQLQPSAAEHPREPLTMRDDR